MELGRPCDLKWLDEKEYGGGQWFSSGWRYRQEHHVNKAGKVLYFQEKELHKT